MSLFARIAVRAFPFSEIIEEDSLEKLSMMMDDYLRNLPTVPMCFLNNDGSAIFLMENGF